MNKNFKVLLAPTKELAETVIADATVEAEYGDYCVEGTQITLAHHGSRSHNPAPCNTEIEALTSGTILVSHIDLDTIGGCLAVMGEKQQDNDFWKAAELIDVKGAHHSQELPEKVQDQLNAVWCWNDTQPRERYAEVIDVTNKVQDYAKVLDAILDDNHPEYNNYIKNGQEWERKKTAEVENKLYKETLYTRCFITDGTFCAASYYSPNTNDIKEATITLNTKFNSITIAFEDGGEKHSAKTIVNELWGPEAGGRDGIAGSPRNWNISEEDIKQEFEKAIIAVNKEIVLEKLADKYYDIPNELLANKDVCNAVLEFIDQNRDELSDEEILAMVENFEENTYTEVFESRYGTIKKENRTWDDER